MHLKASATTGMQACRAEPCALTAAVAEEPAADLGFEMISQ